MTLLHVLAWIVVALTVLFVVTLAALVPLGLKNRRDGGIEVDPDTKEAGPVIPRRFEPYVPPHQPHTDWSEIKDRREQDTPPDDPAS